MTEGELNHNRAQIVVGPDWVGQVHLRNFRGIFTDDFDETTDLIGEVYGWDERVLEGTRPPDQPT